MFDSLGEPVVLRTTPLAFAVLFTAFYAGPVQAAFPTRQRSSYAFAGTNAQRQRHENAIKKLAARSPFFVRGRVERALRKTFAIRTTILVRQRRGKVAVFHPGGRAVFTGVSGKTKTLQGRKGRLLLTRRLVGNTLHERLQRKGRQGYRIRRYVFSKDRKTLTLHTSAYLAKLKKTLRFVLTYQKK